jgi:hypothetical protein
MAGALSLCSYHRLLIGQSKELSKTPVYGLYQTLGGFNNLFLIGRDGAVSTWK